MTDGTPHGTGPAAKQEVLARIRTALGAAPTLDEVPRTYRTGDPGTRDTAALLELLDARLTDYHATVFRTSPSSVAAVVAEAAAAGLPGGGSRLAVSPGLPTDWLPDSAARRSGAGTRWTVTTDDGLTATQLDAVDGAVTGCAVAIAETGTIVLDGSAACGRRALTLVPDLHVCVVTADQVVATVPEGIARLAPTRPQTWISGPSATSDIELDRVEGVHGPRTLHVVLVGA